MRIRRGRESVIAGRQALRVSRSSKTTSPVHPGVGWEEHSRVKGPESVYIWFTPRSGAQ